VKAQRLSAVVISFAVALSATPVLGQLVQLSGGSSTDLQVRGTDNVVDFVPATVSPLPSGDTLVASGPNASATATFAYSDTGFIISDLNYSLGAANQVSTFGQLAGQISFMPLADVIWELDGAYSWDGNWANGVGLFARVTDTGTAAVITLHNYGSAGVLSNVSYTVGVGGGNVFNDVGPTSGVLLAGHQYLYEFGLSVDTNRFSPEVGTATGNLALTFAAVPEPGVLALAGLGLPVLLAAWRRRR